MRALSVRRPETQDTGFCQRSSRQRNKGLVEHVHVFSFFFLNYTSSTIAGKMKSILWIAMTGRIKSWNFRAEKVLHIFFPPLCEQVNDKFFFNLFLWPLHYFKNWMKIIRVQVWKLNMVWTMVTFPRLSSKMPFSHNVNYTNYVNVGIRRFSYNQPLFIFA